MCHTREGTRGQFADGASVEGNHIEKEKEPPSQPAKKNMVQQEFVLVVSYGKQCEGLRVMPHSVRKRLRRCPVVHGCRGH
jgi:hypothetical protein